MHAKMHDTQFIFKLAGETLILIKEWLIQPCLAEIYNVHCTTKVTPIAQINKYLLLYKLKYALFYG